MKKILCLILSLSFTILSLGCASSGSKGPKEPTKLSLQVIADKQVNLDNKFRPSPILVRVYELKNPSTFEQSDFFSLYEKEKVILGEDLLSKEEFLLKPGEEKEINKSSNPETKALGFLAGYQDLGISTWRVVYPLPEAPEASWYRFAIPSNSEDLIIQLTDHNLIVKKRE